MQSLKLKYFPCRKGNEHDGQVLNYICIEENCKEKGLICSICKLKHDKHQTMPLKMLLQGLKDYKEKPLETQSFQQSLERLEEHRNLVLYELKRCVESIADKFKKLEQQICEDFANIKVQLLEKVQLNMKFNEIIQATMRNEYQEQETFTNDFSHIASMVKKDNVSNQITFALNFSQITSNYEKKQKNLRNIFITTQKIIQKELFSRKESSYIPPVKVYSDCNSEEDFMLGDIFDDGIQTSLNAKVPNIFQQLKPQLAYTFSPTYKATSINLSSGNKKARQNSTSSTRFVLVDQGIGKQNQKIAFKISTLKNWVGVGIGLKNLLHSAKYNFNYNKTGHGSYLVSSNSFSWSHSESSDNIKNNSFPFEQGDIVDVTLSPKDIIFCRRKTKKSFKLKINLNQNEWKQACFCANLCSEGDEIQIVPTE